MKSIIIILALSTFACSGKTEDTTTENTTDTITEPTPNCSVENSYVGTAYSCLVAKGKFYISTDEVTGCKLHYYEYSCLSIQTVPVFIQGDFTLEYVPIEDCKACNGNLATYNK
jgi:hypothetical protein